jgi:hypothetical protein
MSRTCMETKEVCKNITYYDAAQKKSEEIMD